MMCTQGGGGTLAELIIQLLSFDVISFTGTEYFRVRYQISSVLPCVLNGMGDHHYRYCTSRQW
jgi:hypothetical protein